MGKSSRTTRSRPSASSSSGAQRQEVTNLSPGQTFNQVSGRNVGAPGSAPGQGLNSPQFATLVFFSVHFATFLTLRRASNDGGGVGSSYCSGTYANHEGAGCSEPDAFFVSVRYHRLCGWLGCYGVCALLCWWDEPGLLQRLNRCLCLSPVGTSLAIAVGYAVVPYLGDGGGGGGAGGSGEALDSGWVSMTAVANLGLLWLVSIPSRRFPASPIRSGTFSTYLNIHDLTLGAYAISAVIYGTYVALAGPKALSDDFEGVGKDLHPGSQAQVALIGAEYWNVAALVGFALFFLNGGRRRAMMFIFGLSHLVQVFLHLPREKVHLRNVEKMNNMLFSSAIALLFFAVLPSAKRSSVVATQQSAGGSKEKKKKADIKFV